MPTRSSGSASSRSTAAASPAATAPSTALRAAGRLIVITSTPPPASSRTGPVMARSLRAEERQLGLALAAQHREVDLDPGDPARLGEDARLRLHRLGREDA